METISGYGKDGFTLVVKHPWRRVYALLIHQQPIGFGADLLIRDVRLEDAGTYQCGENVRQGQCQSRLITRKPPTALTAYLIVPGHLTSVSQPIHSVHHALV